MNSRKIKWAKGNGDSKRKTLTVKSEGMR